MALPRRQTSDRSWSRLISAQHATRRARNDYMASRGRSIRAPDRPRRGCACGDRDAVKSTNWASRTCRAWCGRQLAVEEAEDNNFRGTPTDERWARWNTCSLCEQSYRNLRRVFALGWHVLETKRRRRPEDDWVGSRDAAAWERFTEQNTTRTLSVMEALLFLSVAPVSWGVQSSKPTSPGATFARATRGNGCDRT